MKALGRLLVVLVVLAAGVYLGRDYLAPYLPKGVNDAIGAKSSTSTATADTGSVNGPTPVKGEVVKPAKAREPYVAPKEIDFAFRRMEIDTSKDQPEACLVFTRNLQTDGSIKYEDYLQLDPTAQIAVRRPPTASASAASPSTSNTP